MDHAIIIYAASSVSSAGAKNARTAGRDSKSREKVIEFRFPGGLACRQKYEFAMEELPLATRVPRSFSNRIEREMLQGNSVLLASDIWEICIVCYRSVPKRRPICVQAHRINII